MKSLSDLWKAYDKNNLGFQELKDLSWHIENDEDPQAAIGMATDIGLANLGPVIAKHLDHPDVCIRSFTLGCLVGRLKLSEYAQKAFSMASSDPDEGVRSTAISCLGSVLKKLDKPLQQEIASYIYHVIISKKYDNWLRSSAYDAINRAMEIPPHKRRSLGIKNFDYQVDYNFLENFCQNYKVLMAKQEHTQV